MTVHKMCMCDIWGMYVIVDYVHVQVNVVQVWLRAFIWRRKNAQPSWI